MASERDTVFQSEEQAMWASRRPSEASEQSSSEPTGRRVEWSQGSQQRACLPSSLLLTVAGEVLDGHVLDGNLLEEKGLLASGVPTDDPALPQPPAEPGQVAIAVERV